MIVADVNLLAYLLLGGPDTALAQRVFKRDAAWAVPVLWRSEFRSVLAGCMRKRGVSIVDAIEAYELAERLVGGREYAVRGDAILQLVGSSACSAYDCEYVALAQQLRVPLVTADREVLKAFPDVARTPQAFAGGA
jgi:predicted nucleic acid-binding protein